MTTLKELAPKLLEVVEEAQNAIHRYQSETNRYAMLEKLSEILTDPELVIAMTEVRESLNEVQGDLIVFQKNWPDSSNIAATEYEESNEVLIVTFKNSLKYAYQDFPINKWIELLQTESIGKYINAVVKGAYTSQKIEPVNSL